MISDKHGIESSVSSLTLTIYVNTLISCKVAALLSGLFATSYQFLIGEDTSNDNRTILGDTPTT